MVKGFKGFELVSRDGVLVFWYQLDMGLEAETLSVISDGQQELKIPKGSREFGFGVSRVQWIQYNTVFNEYGARHLNSGVRCQLNSTAPGCSQTGETVFRV